MFKPTVRVNLRDGRLVADFWDCYRLEPSLLEDMKRQVESGIRLGASPVVLVDMTGVGFAGSTALSGFVGMRRSGIRLIFFGLESTVREVFRVSALEGFFTFASDEGEARKLAGPSDLAVDPTATVGGQADAGVAPRSRPTGAPLRRGSAGAGP
jgi:anti-anti-sigma regulatory factor